MAKARQQASLRPERPRKAGKVRRKPARKPAAAPKPTVREPTRARKVSAEARRQAILKAALTVFAARGFEAARLDDVAARAGVAKGTIYLYFDDKESLFQELVRALVVPLAGNIAAAPLSDMPIRAVLDMIVEVFVKEIFGTRRKDVLRLIITEGPRFPKLAEVYYREVVSHGLTMMRALAKRAASEDAFATDAPARYPQLVVAPLLVAVLWDGLFANIDPLDVRGLLDAHLEVLTGKIRKGAP